jgi:hypothetical protein
MGQSRPPVVAVVEDYAPSRTPSTVGVLTAAIASLANH